MFSRLLAPTVAAAIVVLAGCIPPAEDGVGGADDLCPVECPDGEVAVDQCPAFTDCEVFPECDEPNVCAPVDEVDDNNDERPGELDCQDPVRCPSGSQRVETCPAGAVCTAISVCDETILCREAPRLCEMEPKCPGDARPVQDCRWIDDEHCRVENHCSGPVRCLECHPGLPEDCPPRAERVDDPTRCDEEGVSCLRVETCEQTLTCARTCVPDAQCPEPLEEIEGCDEAGDTDCFEVTGCDRNFSCAAPEADADEECDETPSCPEDHQVVELDECLADFEECIVDAACGQVVTCLPTPE